MGTMPQQRPGRSETTVATPRAFLDAVERRFGLIDCDLAATKENAVAGLWLGPGSALAEDSLVVDWAEKFGGLLWLNPPYDDITPWARKCAIEGSLGARVALLVPASIGSNWFRQYVQGQALVVPLAPRLKFVGHTSPYPKDLILCLYGPTIWPGFASQWRWDQMPNKRCLGCGMIPVDVFSNGGKVIAQQCPLCLEFSKPGDVVGKEPPKKKSPTAAQAKIRRKEKAAKADRQGELFGGK